MARQSKSRFQSDFQFSRRGKAGLVKSCRSAARLGNSRFHQGHYSNAARAFRRALDVDPGHLPSLYSLAVSQEKMGEESKAKGTWKKYLELDPDSEWADEARARLGALEKKR